MIRRIKRTAATGACLGGRRSASGQRVAPVCRLGGLLWVLAALLAAGCIFNQPQQRRYYTLVQPAPSRTTDTAFPGDLWVREVQIASVYDRSQIVFRYSPTELRYFSLETWADRPQRMMNQHVVSALHASGLFSSVSDRLGTSPPTWVLDTTVHAIEQIDGGDIWYAHLAMTFRLSRFGENEVLLEYGFSERRPLNDRDVSLTIRAISEIMDEEFDEFIEQIDARLSGREPAPRRRQAPREAVPSAPRPTPDYIEPGNPQTDDDASSTSPGGVVSPPRYQWGGEEVDWRRSPQYTSDPTVVPHGKGAVFLPALGTDPDREPTVEVYAEGEVVASGFMGRRIPVDPGTYEVHFGSGTLAQRMVREVTIREREVEIVEPTWSALEISVVDDKFIAWRGAYEINDRTRSEYVGLGYGADEEQGERTMVWVLDPGVYKIVQPGASYRTRTNFATVQLPPGDFIPFVLVMDPDTGDFLGAGVSDQEDEGIMGVDDVWSLRSSIGGDFLWNSRSGYDAEFGTELALSFFLDNLIRYRKEPHLWNTRIEIEESHRLLGRVNPDGTRESLLSGEFEPVTDRFYINTLYIYELLSWAGPYARVGGETSLFHRYRSPGSEQDVLVHDEDGGLLETYPAGSRERVRLEGTFSPLEFKEGVGVNFRLLHTATADLDLRMGLGGRQYLALGQLLANEERSTEQALVLEEASDSFLLGPEMTVVANARLTRYLQGSTEFDALFPVGDRYQTRFTWRNSVSLRLSNWASLTYTLNLDQNPNVGRENSLLFDQGLRLRITYVIF